ncbi:hypothetical protein H4Q32_029770 [Labeo rohita]|uniref:ribonuclease H n=1 Tax=Labeo rohita TaxID=84645 RepID=A0ABQ8M105_LABRO|nr:hypothetical protein H4Q32_029770 [Labeo rohita]
MQLEQSTAPGLTLQDKNIKFLLYADDLVLLSSTPQGLQQHLDLLENYCQNWALAVNLKKTNIMVFQKKPRCQEHRHQFHLGSTTLEHTMQYIYLGLIITTSGSFSMAVNALKDKARRALYAIKKKFQNIEIPIPIWCKIFNSVVQPIALYGSEYQRHILTKYRLSEHSLTIETDRHKKSWLPRKERVCAHCTTGENETEVHFLLHCHKFKSIRDLYMNKFTNIIKKFRGMTKEEINKDNFRRGTDSSTGCKICVDVPQPERQQGGSTHPVLEFLPPFGDLQAAVIPLDWSALATNWTGAGITSTILQ